MHGSFSRRIAAVGAWRKPLSYRPWIVIASLLAIAFYALATGSSGSGSISLTSSAPVSQNFDTLGTSTSTPSSVLPTGWYLTETGTGAAADGKYLGSTGSSSAGGAYSFGSAAAPTDRALGSVGSGTVTPIQYGAQFTNNTGSAITALTVSYTGEMWRRGPSTAADGLTFAYSTNATDLITGTFTTVAALSFTSPGNACASAAGATDGNSANCRTAISSTITGLNIPNGQTFWLRWTDLDTAGSDDGVAIDDFSLTPTLASATTLSINDVSLNEGNSGTTTFTFTVSLSNPAGPGGVTFDIATADGTATTADGDYTAKSLTTQTIPQGSSTYTFDVLVNGDTKVEGNETFFVNVTNVSGASIADGQGLGTIVNDDAGPALSINDVSLNEGNSGTTTFTFTVSLSVPAGLGGVTFDIATQDGTATTADGDYTAKSLTAQTIAQGLSSYTFDVLVNGDTKVEGNETFNVNVTNVNGASVLDGQGVGTIVNDDVDTPAPTTVKISQVYGGGGNSGATYKNDFIELFNQSTLAVDVSGWSVQQTSAGGPVAPATTWNVTPLCPSGTCTIQPGHYFLVQEGPGAGGTTNLPAFDVSGTLPLGAGSGKVALVNTTTPLSGGCPSSVTIADLVGYDSSATCSETTPAPTPGNTTGVLRKGNGCTDTNNNANDFVELGPLPRNSSAPPQTCGVPGQLSGLGTATPSSVDPGGNTLLKVQVTPGTNSTGIAVTADLSGLGGSATQQFFDDGTNGDAAAGDNTFSYRIDLPVLPTGAKYITTTVTDQQGGHVTVPITITVQSPTCGVERWAIKVGDDADAALVNTASPVRTTIQAMRALPTPATLPLDHRLQPTETNVFVINGLLTLYKLETDVDYHIVLQDPAGNTMVTEIPSPGCDATQGPTPFDAAITTARKKFDAKLTGIPTFQTANLPVQIKGVGFFDFIHGQTGVAPNGVELHPILDITFTAQSTTTLNSDFNPATYGQNINLTATVTIPAGTPTGNVSFFDGATPLGTALLDGTGHASIPANGLTAGTHTLSASYEGDSAASESAGTLSLLVNQATPVLSWTKPAAVNYGSALSNVQLNATANVPGSFVYTPPGGTVLPVGNGQTLSAVFTPTSANYANGPVSTTIDVLPIQQPSGPSINTTRVLSRDGSNNVVVQLTLTNIGGTTANNVVLTSMKVGAVSAPGLPVPVGTIAPNSSAVVTVNMANPIGASGAASSMTAGGAFTGGTFGSSARITLP